MKVNNRFVKSTKIFTRCTIVFYNDKIKKELESTFDLPGRWQIKQLNAKRFKKYTDFCNMSFVRVAEIKTIKKTGIIPEEEFFNEAEIIDVVEV